MSTLKVDNIRHNNATSDAITMASDGTCTAKLTSVGGGPLSHRNYFINGNTIIWQRGTSNPNVNNYGCDRWWFANGATRVDRSTVVPDGFAYSMKVTSNGSTTSIGQPIELIDTGRSQFEPNATYTLSFYARTDSGTNNISATVYYRNGKFSGTNQVNWSPVSQNMGTMTTTFQRFSKTFTAPAAPNANNTVLAIEFNNTATYYITGMQFERGDTMTAYEHRSFGDELLRCQRYYHCVYRRGASSDGNLSIGALGSLYTGNSLYIDMTFPTQMRTTPTLEAPTATDRFNCCPTTCIDFGNPSLIHGQKNAVTLNATLQSGNTAGRVGNVFAKTANWTEGEKLAFTAEL